MAIFPVDPHEGEALWSPYHASKEAGLAFARAWARERAKAGIRAIFHRPPPMPTATRARFYPGEDREGLTPCLQAARDMLALTART